jgi:TorA maturation chaperone TorD
MNWTLRKCVVAVALAGGLALVAGLPSPAAADWREEAIVEAFEDVLDREPSDRELRRYLSRMEEDGWTERDVREDLEERPDYRRHSRRAYQDPDEVIRRAYEDILDRKPDDEGLRLYRSHMIDDDWTERDVRDALRNSPEHRKRSRESAEKIVRRAYEDVLGREPDAEGLASYRDKVLNEGWDEHDVREALRDSAEHREQGEMTREKAEEIVRQAYQEVLGREPDAGSRGYVDQVLKEHWTKEDLARELRKSDEYRRRHQ